MLYHSIISLYFVNPSEFVISADYSSIGHEKNKVNKIRSWKLLCYSVLSGIAKRERRKSYFDISKYAQITKVALSRNMMRYGHMDECGIGTDCVSLRNMLHITNAGRHSR